MPEPPPCATQEGAVTRALQQHLGDHQREQLVVANQLRAAAAGRPPGRKQSAGSAVKRDHEGVEVGAHVGLLVDGAGTRRPSTLWGALTRFRLQIRVFSSADRVYAPHTDPQGTRAPG